jgi:broad specificity phosphatase PhoE
MITRNCFGFLPSQVAFYLQNVHINPRKIYLSYLAESIERTLGEERLAGCESGQLSNNGILYIQSLATFLQSEQKLNLSEQAKDIIVLTGTSSIHHNSVATMKEAGYKVFHTPLLNELRGGDLHGLSKEEIKVFYPEEYEKRLKDKLHYRYPGVGGESYLDVIERLRPIIIELERQRRSIFVICHMAVLRYLSSDPSLFFLSCFDVFLVYFSFSLCFSLFIDVYMLILWDCRLRNYLTMISSYIECMN